VSGRRVEIKLENMLRTGHFKLAAVYALQATHAACLLVDLDIPLRRMPKGGKTDNKCSMWQVARRGATSYGISPCLHKALINFHPNPTSLG
jgi:hypothetical protein